MSKLEKDFLSMCAELKEGMLNVLVMLDVSGSMSDDNMADGASRLKILDGKANFIVVPNDIKPYWDSAATVQSAVEIPQIDLSLVARSGSYIDEFIKDYPKWIQFHGGVKPDLLAIITDGWLVCNEEPECPAVWIITHSSPIPDVPFGTVFLSERIN